MKEWKKTEDLFEFWIDSNPDKYLSIELDIQTVDPQKIIALSRVLDQSKLNRLRQLVMENGWQHLHPGTISLIKFPDDSYVVYAGGNHRAVLSNELGIKEIKAQVTAIVDKSLLTETQLNNILNYEVKIEELHEDIRKEKNTGRKLKKIDKLDSLEREKANYMYQIYQQLKL